MTAGEILNHFRSITHWIEPEKSVDRIIIGDPDKHITRVGVTWMSTFENVREAIAHSCGMLITHEPTFWVHADELAAVASWPADSIRRRTAEHKRRLIEERGLVVLRIHDAWDAMPDIGIPYAWARHLGLGDTPAARSANTFQHRYDIEPMTLDSLAGRIASRTAELGESAVQVIGPPDQIIFKVGIGTGCYCDIQVFHQLDCEASIICDDSNWYWEGIAFAADSDHSIIRVNHGVSEEPGMITLTQYINDTLPISAEYIPHGASFRLVGRS
ncbi:MAG TPA: Nif3-like dinuclear metal center hexameric protein [Armatimonadota bacterium]|nr:Nif3-like dinuclear metal center hexameric protein [Armatimonadota bacterium]